MAKVVALAEQTQSLRALSAADRQTYDEQGFVIVDNVFPPEVVTALNDEIERLMPEHGDTTANRPRMDSTIGAALPSSSAALPATNASSP